LRPLIAAIGEEFAQQRIQTEQSRENHNPNVAILNVGGMNHGLKQEAYGIDEDVTLLAFDLLARVVAARVDAALTAADVERMKSQIIAGKTAKPRAKTGRGGKAAGGPGVAAHTVGMLATILQYAINPLRLIKENPAHDVKKPTDGKQRRFLTLDEIGRLGAVMRGSEAAEENPVALAAIRILLLTGFRRMEALALPKTWIDPQAHCIRFGDTKSGAQLRVIGVPAVRLLEALPARAVSPWVFPGETRQGHFVGLPKVLARLCAKAGLEGVTLHVLRHSFAATAAGMGYSELTIAGLLGHSVPGVTARYAHVPDAALVSAADRIAATIAAALDDVAEVGNERQCASGIEFTIDTVFEGKRKRSPTSRTRAVLIADMMMLERKAALKPAR
jgi:integrase